MRKLYLITLLLGAALAVLSCTQPKEEGEAKTKTAESDKNIYIQLYSVREAIGADLSDTIAKVAQDGYTGVEAANYKDGMFYGMSPEEFKSAIEGVGMEVLSSHTTKQLEANIEETNWDEVWAWWDVAIDAHKRAGMKYIVAPWMPTPTTLKDLKKYCDYYNNIGEKCNAAGLSFGYHNHKFEYQEIEGELMYNFMLENTDPDKVFFRWMFIGLHKVDLLQLNISTNIQTALNYFI